MQPEVAQPVQPAVPVQPEVAQPVQPAAPEEPMAFAGFGGATIQSESPVQTEVSAPVQSEPVAQVEQPAVSADAEQQILKEVEQSTPTDLDDGNLKLEDTLSKNNLKEEIKQATNTEEPKSNKKALIFVVSIFIILGMLIILLPTLIQLF